MMGTYSSILVFIFCTFSATDWAFSQNYEALVVVENIPIPSEISLPFKAKEENGQIIYPNVTEDGTEIEYLYLCPARTSEIKDYIQGMSQNSPELAFSLEKNSSTEDPRRCQDEVKPALVRNVNPQLFQTQCGNVLLDHYTPYTFGFNYVRPISDPPSNMPHLKIRITTMKLYDICIRAKGTKMFWTKHRVATGFMLQEPGFPSQQIQPPYEFSAEPFSFHEHVFSNIAKGYNNQDAQAPYKMIPQMLVPEEDFALKIIKKATTHYMNTSPLWEKLVPLMKAINDGIRKVAVEISVNTYNSKTHTSEKLDIYTLVYPYTYRTQLVELVHTTNIHGKQRFGLNVWCKFVHHENRNRGILIFLHNLPNIPPKKIILESSDLNSVISLENAECEIPVPCNFRKWSKGPVELSEDLLNYAYCCAPSTEKIQELFNMKLNTQLELLEINDSTKEKSIQEESNVEKMSSLFEDLTISK